MALGKKTGGRIAGTPNKATSELRELAQQYTSQAIETLYGIMVDETTPPATRVNAAIALMDRGHGKPRQELEIKQHIVDPFPDEAELDALTLKGMAEAQRLEEARRTMREKIGVQTLGMTEVLDNAD